MLKFKPFQRYDYPKTLKEKYSIMKKRMTFCAIAFLSIVTVSCAQKDNKHNIGNFCDATLKRASDQLSLLEQDAEKEQKIPRTVSHGKISWAEDIFDWTEGFFPGSMWYNFENTGDSVWLNKADHFQTLYADQRFLPYYHDLGFVFWCSYGNGYRLTKNEKYKQILIDAGNTLVTRYDSTVGCIRSWDVNKGWQSKRNWQFPVIIDNMMNLELLFELSKITGDPKYRSVAVSHANTTLKNHFRNDYSSYHVVDYDTITGDVRSKQTAQGYAHESAWARGQAWGLYGFTMCFRYTNDSTYLKHANSIARFILNNPQIPSDHVPYWDYNAPKIPDEPRDVSAAAITASALIELSSYTNGKYLNKAIDILTSLEQNYQPAVGTNNHFILNHSVGSIPHNHEIDVPLNYADYYYIEALVRLKKSYPNPKAN